MVLENTPKPSKLRTRLAKMTPNEVNPNDSRNINTIKGLVQQMGFKEVSLITTEFHDEVIGFTSQLAHVIALSLINSDDPKRETKRIKNLRVRS